MRGVIGHCVPIRGARVIHGLPVVSPELAWLQLATLVSVDDLVVAGDYLVRRRLPLSTMSLLREQVDAASRARGIVAARLALGDVRSGTDSPPESRTRLVIVRAGLPEPIIGHTVIDDDGYFVGTPDLAYIDKKIAIEYEGEGHRTDKAIYDDDIDRRERFEAAGWKVIRVRAHHLRDPHQLAQRVRLALAERGFHA